jgi:hypothetical protein
MVSGTRSDPGRTGAKLRRAIYKPAIIIFVPGGHAAGDGHGLGGAAAVTVATLTSVPFLNAADLLVI